MEHALPLFSHALKPHPPVDYLLVGHATQDVLPNGGSRLGGTVTFSGLTARALGHSVGVITACAPDCDLSPLDGLTVSRVASETTTTFRNISTPRGRIQYLYHPATQLDASHLPQEWLKPAIVHLGPVAAEVDPMIYRAFSDSLICLTPQGWLRGVDPEGRVHPVNWPFDHELLKACHACVISLEDVSGKEELIEEFAAMCKLLVVTENKLGARVHWNGDVHSFPAPSVDLIEDTGAGDIFAACFFHRLYKTKDPWEAARFAVKLAAQSVTRTYLDSIPSPREIEGAKVEII
jgi:sugar/nucleoside kinase (ribokinase family)